MKTFSALQRAEIAEINLPTPVQPVSCRTFSALQRAEIAEIVGDAPRRPSASELSVLFNEPKLLKSSFGSPQTLQCQEPFSALQRAEIAEITLIAPQSGALLVLSFSALQRAEIAEIRFSARFVSHISRFQCSSTSRNC